MQVELTNSKGTFQITQLVPTLKISGNYKQAARTLGLQVLSSPTDKSIPKVETTVGSLIRVFEGTSNLFFGYVVTRTKNTESNTVQLTCFDKGWKLKQNNVIVEYEQKTPESVVAELVSPIDVKIGFVAATGIPITRRFLNGDSIYNIISTMYTEASKVNEKNITLDSQGSYWKSRKLHPATKVL